jgi:hypothetical protein
MAKPLGVAPLSVMLHLLDEAFDRPAWHGPNLRGILRGVTVAQAAWRLSPGRHSIYELVLHVAYWKYAVRRRLTGGARASFGLRGSNWFAQPGPLTPSLWREARMCLADEHRRLRAVVALLPPNALAKKSPGGRHTVLRQIVGAGAHDLYHAGQIQLLKRLARVAGRRRERFS